jgi:GrpB-like predicted nucleotidyltransferase (UPF0157 family)
MTQNKAPSSSKIEIVPYDNHWPALFKAEASRIQNALKKSITSVVPASLICLQSPPLI